MIWRVGKLSMNTHSARGRLARSCMRAYAPWRQRSPFRVELRDGKDGRSNLCGVISRLANAVAVTWVQRITRTKHVIPNDRNAHVEFCPAAS